MWYIIPHTKPRLLHTCTRHTGTRADFFFGMYPLETRSPRIITAGRKKFLLPTIHSFSNARYEVYLVAVPRFAMFRLHACYAALHPLPHSSSSSGTKWHGLRRLKNSFLRHPLITMYWVYTPKYKHQLVNRFIHINYSALIITGVGLLCCRL